jgi:hypothetical protein
MNSVSPVLTEREQPYEIVVALDQQYEYYPIIAVKITFENHDNIASYTRYRFTDKEREAIARGADLLLSQPHHGPLMPLGLQLAFPGEYPLEEKLLL